MSSPLIPIGKMVLAAGIILMLIGLVMVLSGKFLNLGRLPGDIFIKKENFWFYFPLASSIVLSIVLTLMLNIFFRR